MNDYVYIQITDREAVWCRTQLRLNCIYKIAADYYKNSTPKHGQILSPVEVLTRCPVIEAIPELKRGERPPLHWVGSDKV